MVSSFQLGFEKAPISQTNYSTPGAMEQAGFEELRVPWATTVVPELWRNTETLSDILSGPQNLADLHMEAYQRGEERLSVEELKAKYPHMNFDIPQYASTAKYMAERQARIQNLEWLKEHSTVKAPGAMLIPELGSYIAKSFTDPLEVGLMVATAGVTGLAAKAFPKLAKFTGTGLSYKMSGMAMPDNYLVAQMQSAYLPLSARLTGRFAEGFLENAIGNAVVEPWVASASKSLGDDYTAMSSAMNILVGGLTGGIFHTTMGAIADPFTRMTTENKLKSAAEYIALRANGEDGLTAAAQNILPVTTLAAQDIYTAKNIDITRTTDGQYTARFTDEQGFLRNSEGITGRTPGDAIRNLQYTYATKMNDAVLFHQLNKTYGNVISAKTAGRNMNPFASGSKLATVKNTTTVRRGTNKYKLDFESPADRVFYAVNKILSRDKNKNKGFSEIVDGKETLTEALEWITNNLGDATEADIRSHAAQVSRYITNYADKTFAAGDTSKSMKIPAIVKTTDFDIQPEFLSADAWKKRLNKQKEILLGADKEAAINLLGEIYNADRELYKARLESLKTARGEIQKLISATDEQLKAFSKRDLARKNIVDSVKAATKHITDEQLTQYLYMLDVVTGDFARFMEENNITFTVSKEQQLKTEKRLMQLVYHGTPAYFEHFNLEYAYSGEGNDAHGYGIYVSKNKQTAENYAEVLTGDKGGVASYLYHVEVPEDSVLLHEHKRIFDKSEYTNSSYIRRRVDRYIKAHPEFIEIYKQNYYLRDSGKKADSNFALSDMYEYLTGKTFYKIVGEIETANMDEFTLYTTPHVRNKTASKTLSKLGIKGFRYRGRTDGECCVIFNDRDLQIQSTEISPDRLITLPERIGRIRNNSDDPLQFFKASTGEILADAYTFTAGELSSDVISPIIEAKSGKYILQTALKQDTDLDTIAPGDGLDIQYGLDKALQQSFLKQDTILYRGLVREEIEALGLYDVKPGMIIQSKGYLSTSFKESEANVYALSNISDENSILLEVRAPRGSTAIDIDAAIALYHENAYGSYGEMSERLRQAETVEDLETDDDSIYDAAFTFGVVEGEVLLPRDLALKVLDIRQEGNQQRIIVTPDATLNNIYGNNILRENIDVFFNKVQEMNTNYKMQLDQLQIGTPEHKVVATEAFFNGYILSDEVIQAYPDLRVAKDLTQEIPGTWLMQATNKESLANRIVGEFMQDLTPEDFSNQYGYNFVYDMGGGKFTKSPARAIEATGKAVLYKIGEGAPFRIDFEGFRAGDAYIIEELLKWEPALRDFLSQGPEAQTKVLQRVAIDAFNFMNKSGVSFLQYLDAMNLTNRGKIKKQTEFGRLSIDDGEIIYPLKNIPGEVTQIGEVKLFEGMTPAMMDTMEAETIYKAIISGEINKVENLQTEVVKLQKEKAEIKKQKPTQETTQNQLDKNVETQEKKIKKAKKELEKAKKVRESKINNINKKAEPYNTIVKGAVDVGTEGKYIVSLFQNADISTLVHETAHIFRRTVLDADMLEQAEAALGVKNGKWTVKNEEDFARAFEKYLAEGKAPVKGLEAIFEAFKSWLTQIYMNLSQSPMEQDFSPEIRKVFDQLFAEERVRMAEQAGYKHENVTKQMYQNALTQHKDSLTHINKTIKDTEAIINNDRVLDQATFAQFQQEKLARIQSKLNMLETPEELTQNEIRDKMKEVSAEVRRAESEYAEVAENQFQKNQEFKDTDTAFYENELALAETGLMTYAKTLGLTEEQVQLLLEEVPDDLKISRLNEEAEANSILEGALREFGNCARGEL